MRHTCLIALLACAAAISCVAATRVLDDDAAGSGRSLLQADSLFTCSRYCEANQCVRVGTTGNVKCNKCYGNMKPLLTGARRGQCGCPPGTFFDYNDGNAAQSTCAPCPFGSYCYNKLTFVTNTATGDLGVTPCGTGLTTRTRRATSAFDCVNDGGYKLVLNGTKPTAEMCTNNTYAIAKSKQTACTACPAGFVILDTNPSAPIASEHDEAIDCLVPPGYFLKSPGQIAPCDAGSYQPSYLKQAEASVEACTPCPEGVSTLRHKSTLQSDCKKLKPGYVATKIVDGQGITEATLCPQGYYCPGDLGSSDDAKAVILIGTLSHDNNFLLNDTNYIVNITRDASVQLTASGANSAKMVKCTNNAWTKGLGATKLDECLIPPGFRLNGGNIVPCASGTYRAKWIAYNNGAVCTACGAGIQADPIEPLSLYYLNQTTENNTDTTEVTMRVQASSQSCYIVQGQGMYYVANTGATGFVYKARNCGFGSNNVANSYGVSGTTYGLSQTPCKLCPSGTEVTTTRDSEVKGANGYYDPLACVTKAGYGWDGRQGTLCAAGWYNPGDNYDPCTQCEYGLTTNSTGSTVIAQCLQAKGFGQESGINMLCPAGTYNDEVRSPTTCKACSSSGQGTNTWTEDEGSDATADCNICKPGFGGTLLSNCAACGGDSSAGSYGPTGRDSAQLACVNCPVSEVGFIFYYQGVARMYKSPARAVEEAQTAAQCVAAMAQIADSVWHLGGAATAVTSISTNDLCADHCLATGDCMFSTFNYAQADVNLRCSIRTSAEAGSVITAMKAVPSSDVTLARKLLAKVNPKAISTGMYTQWLDSGAGIGNQANAGESKTVDLGACFDVCDVDENCAGVVWDPADNNATNCKIITGDTDMAGANAAKRSLTRAKPSLFNRN